MSPMSPDPRMPFFDALAERWDSLEDMEGLQERLGAALQAFGVAPQERVLEVGCGTGNLTLALSRHLDATGEVVAVDCSRRMLERAQAKVQDPRITWVEARVQDLPEAWTAFDRAILMGVWPHLDAKNAVLERLRARLLPGGLLHLWHRASRAHINGIHAAAHPAVAEDLLEPASEAAQRVAKAGFEILEVKDDDRQYLVSARKA